MKDGNFTNEFMQVKYANSTRNSLPDTMANVDTPYVKGGIAAACFTGLSNDIILGYRYVLLRPNPETCTPVNVATVETRSQKRRAKTEPMAMTVILVQNILPTELRKLQ